MSGSKSGKQTTLQFKPMKSQKTNLQSDEDDEDDASDMTSPVEVQREKRERKANGESLCTHSCTQTLDTVRLVPRGISFEAFTQMEPLFLLASLI